MLVLQWLQLEEAEWSEQLENLKGDSHTKSASSENQDPAGGGSSAFNPSTWVAEAGRWISE